MNVPALADKRVRQAFAYVFDRERMVASALHAFGRPTSILWPKQSPAYDAGLHSSGPYDPVRARDLLSAAGWDYDTALPLTTISTVSATQLMAEVLQQDLADVGVNVWLQKLEPAVYTPRLQKGQLAGAWIASVGYMNASPATLYASAFSVRVPNASNFESPRYKELIDQSRTETDDQKLKTIMRELTQITIDKAFVIPIAESASQPQGLEVVRASVRDASWDDWGWCRYQDLWLEH